MYDFVSTQNRMCTDGRLPLTPLSRRDTMSRMSVGGLFTSFFSPLSVRTVILVLVLCAKTEANHEWQEDEAVIVNTREARHGPGSGSGTVWNSIVSETQETHLARKSNSKGDNGACSKCPLEVDLLKMHNSQVLCIHHEVKLELRLTPPSADMFNDR